MRDEGILVRGYVRAYGRGEGILVRGSGRGEGIRWESSGKG